MDICLALELWGAIKDWYSWSRLSFSCLLLLAMVMDCSNLFLRRLFLRWLRAKVHVVWGLLPTAYVSILYAIVFPVLFAIIACGPISFSIFPSFTWSVPLGSSSATLPSHATDGSLHRTRHSDPVFLSPQGRFFAVLCKQNARSWIYLPSSWWPSQLLTSSTLHSSPRSSIYHI